MFWTVSVMEDPGQYVLTFGKHKDKPLSAVLESDPQYLVWLSGASTTRTMKKSSLEAHAKLRAEQGDTCIDMAKKLVSGRCYRCLAVQCNCLARVGRQYQYHPYGKRN